MIHPGDKRVKGHDRQGYDAEDQYYIDHIGDKDDDQE